MSEGGRGLSSAAKELIVVILVFLAIGFLWLAFGGLKTPTQSANTNNSKIENSTTTQKKSSSGFWSFFTPFDFNATSSTLFDDNNYGIENWYDDNYSNTDQENSGNTKTPNEITYNSYQRDIIYYGSEQVKNPTTNNPDKIFIDGVSTDGYSSSNGETSEYLTMSAPSSNKNKFLITGLTLKSRMTGQQVQIGEAVTTYYANTANAKTSVFLAPGEQALIITRRSPIGQSFKINKCMGYLTQYQEFYPYISTNCPLISDYPYPERPNAFTDDCLNFLDGIGSCQSPSTSYIPEGLPQNCINFATERANYNRCVSDFSNTKDFISPEWRIYLGRNESIWKSSREIIDVIDQKGNIIQSYTY